MMKNAPITSSLPQLKPGLRWIAWVGWVFIVLAHLIIFLADLNLDFAQMLVPCTGEDCNFLTISPAEIAVLESWGLTTRAYAFAMNIVPIVVLLVHWALGGLILWRQGNSWLGLAVSLALVVLPIITNSGDTGVWTIINPALALLGLTVTTLGTVIMLLFFYLIPNGRFSPGWAYIPLICTVLLLSVSNLEISGLITLSAELLSLLNITLVSLALLIGGFQIYRYLRDSTPTERQQTKWILAGILISILGVIIWVLIFGRALDIPAGTPRLLANLLGGYINLIALLVLPAAITMAILRYRLWDIDFVINRALVYGALTALLIALFGGILLIINLLFQNFGGGPLVALTISAAAFGDVFQPARRRLQRFVDQRFYHIYIDYQKTPPPSFASSGMT